MFVGSINAHTRKYLIHQVGAFEGRRVVVGCSGNFTFEGLLCRYGRPATLHANDVSLYSCSLGRWLTGQPVQFEVQDAFDWLRPFCETDEDRVATILATSGMLKWLSGKPNAHKTRMLAGYREQFARIHAETREKMRAVAEGLTLTEFFAGDVVDHFRRFADDLTDSERVVIQLSHNALSGQDNLAALKELYEQIADVELQQYAGLDDVTVGRFEEVAPAAFQDATLDFEEVYLSPYSYRPS